MSVASSSSMLQAFRSVRPRSINQTYSLSTYTPRILATDDSQLEPRPPRPTTSTFFTGRPTYHTAVLDLEAALSAAQKSLRTAHIYPLPSTLQTPQPPRAAWHPAPVLSNILGTQLRTNSHRRILDLLNELHLLRHVASLTDHRGVEGELDEVLGKYEREERSSEENQSEKSTVDVWGRAYGFGRRKESSARVWIIPSTLGRKFLDVDADLENNALVEMSDIKPAEILINHQSISEHFPKITDREIIMRPLKISGLLGAFNIFALTRGGGTSGQAGAVGLALARALVVMRGETEEILQKDGALMRDTRMVERKKTGSAKARKKYAWVKR